MLFILLLFAKSGLKNSVTDFTNASQRSGIFTNLAQAHSFYLVPGVALSVRSYVLLYSASNYISHPVLRAGWRRASSTKCRGLSLYLLLLFLLAGDIEINPGPVRIQSLGIGQLNICSLRNKAAVLHNFLCQHSLHIFALNETWLQPNDTAAFISDLTPPTFSILNEPRSSGKGGGLAFLFKSYLPLHKFSLPIPMPKSFEVLAATLNSGNKQILFVNIYRPPSFSLADFLSEFQSLLEYLISSPSEIVIMGDFNIHVDVANHYSLAFLDMLEGFDMHQLITFPTHNKGHILDVLITRSDSKSLHSVTSVESYFSDHVAILSKFDFPFKPPPNYRIVKFRPWHKIDLNKLKNDILESPLLLSPAQTANELAVQFQSTLIELLDKQIPFKIKRVVERTPQPWFNSDISEARRRRSQLERWWRHSRLPSDHIKFKQQCKHVRKLVSSAKSAYLTNLIAESSASPKSLWLALNKLLHREKLHLSPTICSATHDLASKFLKFFADKISSIRLKLASSSALDKFLYPNSTPPIMDYFLPTTLGEVRTLIFSSPNKTSLLDTIPTWFLKDCFDVLGPTITSIINFSLHEGSFPSTFADAIVHPLLKKPSLDPDDLSNYRPISTLNFVSKILERIVMNRMQTHLSSNSLLSPFQSAYRRFHSTESALLTVHNDIICSMDGGKVTALVLLDLSAAFDTVDHSILLHRLKNWFGISGPALNWFSTYLSPRTQSVYLNGNYSSSALLTCGVPQGSVLGPLLFTLYTTPLGTLLNNHSLGYHFYADDTQIYISFDSLSCDSSVQLLSAVFDEVQSWMASNKLLLNPSKTEFLLLGTPQQLKKFDGLKSLKLGDSIVEPADAARNLGVVFNSTMSLTGHVNSICKSSYMFIRDIRRIKRYVPMSARISLANALVSSRLDYCNSLLTGINKSNILKLQRVQNSLARAITNTSKYEHITPVLKSLHWLPVQQRIRFKLGLIVYKTLNSSQPQYLKSVLIPQTYHYSMRSSDCLCLVIPKSRTVLGERAFSVAGPSFWNSLPVSVRCAQSHVSFRSRLKTYLFQIAYPP
jgi:hypothetical protein